MALEQKPGKRREFFSPTFWPPCLWLTQQLSQRAQPTSLYVYISASMTNNNGKQRVWNVRQCTEIIKTQTIISLLSIICFLLWQCA